MAKTKAKRKPKAAPAEPAAEAAGAPPQKLDDRTALDDAADRKREAESLPRGFQQRLPGGTDRVVTVNKDELGKEGGLPFRVKDLATGETIETNNLRIEGASQGVATAIDGCTATAVGIWTGAPILVGASRKVPPK